MNMKLLYASQIIKRKRYNVNNERRSIIPRCRKPQEPLCEILTIT